MERNQLIVVHGKDPAEMAREAARAAGLERIIPAGALISFKPNLVVAKSADSGAVTHPELIEGLVGYLREHGFSRFEVIEGSWVGDSTPRAFAAAGYTDLSRRLGIPLVDLQKDGWKWHDCRGGKKIALCDRAMGSDFLINLPVVKGHCQTALTCALKNLKGCIPDDEKSRFHQLGLHEPIALLNCILKPGFILCDGICGDLDFEEGGNPVPMDRLVAGIDPVLVDAYACRLLGHSIEDVPYIGLAEEYGVGSSDLSAAEITVRGDYGSAPAAPPRTGRVKALASRIREEGACSACYAALVHALARAEERGFLAALDKRLGSSGEKKIAIGKLFEGRAYAGLGCGRCASGAEESIPGCPPDGAAVAARLEELARS